MPAKLLLAALLLLCGAAGHAAERTITVFAASSLSDVLQEINQAFTADTGITVRVSPAASSALARQIESGSPADVFISADQEWMDYLASRKLIKTGTRVDIVSNSLVLVAPADSKVSLRIAPGLDLAKALGRNGRLSIGDPASVPAGRYAAAALRQLGAWSQVKDRLIPSDNVRTALNFVALGEAPLGIVYATDAQVDPAVRIVDTFPASSHQPITYPGAVVRGAPAQAGLYLLDLAGAEARATWRKFGFVEVTE